MRPLGWVVACVVPLGGCAAVLDFDLREEEQGPASGSSGSAVDGASTGTQGGGSAISTSTSSANGGGSGGSGVGGGGGSAGGGAGGDCAGCIDGVDCVDGTAVAACGTDGGACEVCEGSGECSVAACLAVGCDFIGFPDGTACVGGQCERGACIPGNEDCTNGEDDDRNGAIDCADARACGTIASCIPLADSGWLGPFAVYDASGQIDCPSVWPDRIPTLLHRDADESDFACGTCACDSHCHIRVDLFGDKTCTDPVATASVEQGVCVQSLIPAGASSVELSPRGFACEATVAGRDLTPATWSTTVTLCGASGFGGGCGAAQCASVPPLLGDEVHVCIAREGSFDCPATGFTQSREAFAAAQPTDTRACAACDCAPPDGDDCGGKLNTYTEATCTMCGGLNVACSEISPGCLDLTDGVGLGYAEYAPDKQCAPSGGAETGAVAGELPWSICCLD